MPEVCHDRSMTKGSSLPIQDRFEEFLLMQLK